MDTDNQNSKRQDLINRNMTNRRLQNEGIFMSVSKKAEKVTTAMYMVTDLINENDPIRNKIRMICVGLVSDIRNLNYSFAGDVYFNLGKIISKTWELMSLIEISVSVGFISDMNYAILKNALIDLISNLRNKQKIEGFRNINDIKIGEGEASNFNLKAEFFKLDDEDKSRIKEEGGVSSFEEDEMSFIKNTLTVYKKPASVRPKTRLKAVSQNEISPVNTGQKTDRQEKILALVGKDNDISIKDIITNFEGISQKTIQRDLVKLVGEGKIKKTGEKRWSRYSVK